VFGFGITVWALFTVAASALAQSYPYRPIRLIVPFPPGGSTDTYSRIISVKLSEALGQQLVLDNRAGAAGALGAELAANAVADGYTIVLGQDGNLVVGQAVRKTKNYDTLAAFAPISLVVRTPQVFVVNDKSPLRSVNDLIAAAKASPGALTFASAGTAGSSHVMGAFFNGAMGINTVHVPYDQTNGHHHRLTTSSVQGLNWRG
jgi:tripartite-type tricarboxylate transporter receptor subunit TctC